MAGNFNVHSSIWNFYCHKRQNATILEELIDQFGLLINNKPERATCLLSKEISVTNLALSTTELRSLILWKIPEEYPSLSNHELIVLCWEDILVDFNSINQKRSEIISWAY